MTKTTTMQADSNNQINSHGPLKKRNWYSALSKEQKEEVCRKKREAYARKKSLANDAINNKQIVATSARDEDGIVHHEGTPNIEKTINDGGCQKDRRAMLYNR